MSATSLAVRDTATMFRRDLRHSLRFPMLTMSGILVPVVFLLLFDGVFGRALAAGLRAAPGGGGHGSYIGFLAPGILVMTAGFAAESTAVKVCSDAALGVIDRFRTMAIWRGSVLAGQVAGSMVRTMASGALVVALAVALGFRPTAGPAAWLAAAGMFAMLAFALTWLTVAIGLLARTPAGANGLALLPAILPFVSSAFVPTGAMPAGVAWFARTEPFTPVIDTIRGLLTGTAIGSSAVLATAWCAGLALAGYLAAVALFQRAPERQGLQR